MRVIDRALGRAGSSAGDADFSTRPFGTSKAEAAAIAAAASSAPGSGTVSGTTGATGTGSNMTSSSYGHVGASDRGPIQ